MTTEEKRIVYLEEQLRNRDAEISILNESGRVAANELDLRKLLQKISDQAIRIIDAETVLVPILDTKCTEYTYMAGSGVNATEIIGESLPIDMGVCGWIWRNKRSWWRGVLDELSEDERVRWEKEAGSIIMVPLIGKKHFLGGIAGLNKREGKDFDERDMELLELFATQITAGVENAYLYQELQRLNTELENRVKDRTEALTKSNIELELAIQTLKETQSQLIESEKLASLGSLVAGVSHELNTPLGICVTAATTIEHNNQELADALGKEAVSKKFLKSHIDKNLEGINMILVSLTRATELVKDFKQVAVDQTSEMRRTFELSEVIRENATTLQPQFKKTPHEIHLDLMDGIQMNGYPGPLQRVITNLVLNALFHAFDENTQGIVRITASMGDDDMAVITVSDNGCGISHEHTKKVFDPFFTTKMGQGGSGLGMHIAYNIITGVMGGSISLKSTPGMGTEVKIIIPLEAPREVETQPNTDLQE